MDQLPNEQILLRSAILAASDGFVITDNKGTILWVNPAVTKLTGYAYEELVGQNPRILKSNKQDNHFYENLWSTISRGEIWTGTLENKKKDGTVYIEEMTINPVKTDGVINHFIAIKRDVTEKIKARDELVESEMRYKTIFDLTPDVILVISVDGVIKQVNPRIQKLLGYEQSEIVGQHLKNTPFLPAESKLLGLEKFALTTLGHDLDPYELDVITKQGDIRVASVKATVMRDNKNNIIGILVIASDITERKQIELEEGKRTRELEEINNLMVNRELKMIELKNEIARLKALGVGSS